MKTGMTLGRINMDTLYRFGLNTEDGTIEVREIDDYEYRAMPYNKSYYRYRGKSQWNYARECNLDKMVNNAVYTFNPSKKHAKEIMRGALIDKRYELVNKLGKIEDLLRKTR